MTKRLVIELIARILHSTRKWYLELGMQNRMAFECGSIHERKTEIIFEEDIVEILENQSYEFHPHGVSYTDGSHYVSLKFLKYLIAPYVKRTDVIVSSLIKVKASLGLKKTGTTKKNLRYE